MFFSIIRKSTTCTTLRRFYVSLAANNYALVPNRRSKDSVLQCITFKNNAVSHRYSWTGQNELTKCLPLLPDGVQKSKMWMAVTSGFVTELFKVFLVDEGSDVNEVVDYMKAAACKISMELVNKNYDYLDGLVVEDTLQLLKERINSLTPAQRNLIAIREEDIMQFSLYSFAVRHTLFIPIVNVEAKIVIFYKPRYGQIEGEEDRDDNASDKIQLPNELVANYVFSREYKPSGNSDWIISYINIDTGDLY